MLWMARGTLPASKRRTPSTRNAPAMSSAFNTPSRRITSRMRRTCFSAAAWSPFSRYPFLRNQSSPSTSCTFMGTGRAPFTDGGGGASFSGWGRRMTSGSCARSVGVSAPAAIPTIRRARGRSAIRADFLRRGLTRGPLLSGAEASGSWLRVSGPPGIFKLELGDHLLQEFRLVGREVPSSLELEHPEDLDGLLRPLQAAHNFPGGGILHSDHLLQGDPAQMMGETEEIAGWRRDPVHLGDGGRTRGPGAGGLDAGLIRVP